MPLNAGHASFGPVPGAAGPSSGQEASETDPLLPPEPELCAWRPLNQQELRAAAGGPGWRSVRCSLVVLFWLAWVTLLAVAVSIVVVSPRPIPVRVTWWQKGLFYRWRPEPEVDTPAGRSEVMNAACERLPYLRSVGVRAVILEGLFDTKASAENFHEPSQNLEALVLIQLLLTESSKADLRVLLDFCKVNLLELQEETGSSDKLSNHSAAEKPALRFWLEQGVAGFVICDTDAAYSVQTLLEWRGVLEEFSSQDNERILMVKQNADVLQPLNISTYGNVTLVNLVMRSILPEYPRLLSAADVTEALETRLQPIQEDVWPSWTVGGEVSQELKQLFVVLMMTLPGSPAFQDEEENNQTRQQDEETRSALFTTLSRSRDTEEALLYGSYTFLPSNTSSNSSSPPPLAFLRSWGCVHFLVLLNVGPEPQSLDPAWAPSLPEKGVFVASTGMNHSGVASLYSISLRPHEAVVIKLFEAGSSS